MKDNKDTYYYAWFILESALIGLTWEFACFRSNLRFNISLNVIWEYNIEWQFKRLSIFDFNKNVLLEKKYQQKESYDKH